MTTHQHDFYAVQFSWGGYWECACGHLPDEAEWNVWADRQTALDTSDA